VSGLLTVRAVLLLLFSHRFLAAARWDFYFVKLRLANTISRQPRRIRKFVANRRKPMYLNLGCGPRGIQDSHWVNVDGFRDENVQFLLDISRPLPFQDNLFDGVFCEHVLEHFPMADGLAIAREVFRILRPEGCFRIVVPDGELVIRRYFDAPSELIARRGTNTETAMEIVNVYFRQRYEHQFMYDWTTIEKMLSIAGFPSVARVSYGKSDYSSCIALDDEKYEWESLYVEASKFQRPKKRLGIYAEHGQKPGA